MGAIEGADFDIPRGVRISAAASEKCLVALPALRKHHGRDPFHPCDDPGLLLTSGLRTLIENPARPGGMAVNRIKGKYPL